MSRKFRKNIKRILGRPWEYMDLVRHRRSGFHYGRQWRADSREPPRGEPRSAATRNPLRAYFEAHTTGPGIFKWVHYFDVYQRHLNKFVGKEVHLVEVGVYSGGSLDMWREYFGSRCTVYGVDVQEACMAYEKEGVHIFIGDQADREFWRSFKRRVAQVDILIDDGGHQPEQQIATLEEMLPHLCRGGVYVCEDVHGLDNKFLAYVTGLSRHLNSWSLQGGELLAAKPTEFQREIHSIHLYPYLAVIEKLDAPIEQFAAPKHGTVWQPFLSPRSRR